MSGIFLLMIITIGSVAASIIGPMETLQDNPNILFNNQESDDPPDLMELGHMIMTDMQDLLANQERSLEARLKQLELYVDHTCRYAGTTQTQQDLKVDIKGEMSQMLDGYMHYMLSRAQDFADNLQQQLDSKIELAMIKIEEKFSDITVSPKSSASETSKSVITSSGINDQTLSVLLEKIEDELKSVITQNDLQKQTENFDNQILSLITLLNNTSSHQVLNFTKDIRDILYSFKPVYETFRTAMNNCKVKEDQFNQMEQSEQLLQEIKVKVDDNGNILSNIFLAIENTEDMLAEKLTVMESLTEQTSINSSHLQISSAPTPTPVSTESMSECQDSEFLGGKRKIDICSAAVKYNTCQFKGVAYHCCRTCTDAGKISDVGPHRYLTYPREVRLFGGLE